MDYLFDQIRKILKRLRGAERLFFFLDYDGTLTPIVPHPEKAKLSQEMKGLLLTFKKNPRILLAIMSGRSLEDIRHRVGLKGIYFVGNHGLEIFTPGSGIKRLISAKVIPELQRIRDRLNDQLKEMEGVLLEDKGSILTLHYRNADPRWVPPLLMTLKQEIKDSMDTLSLGFGKMAFEIRPKSMVNKGTAVSELLNQVDRNRVLPLYIGDDQTDEDAFRVLKRKGITIWVGLPNVSSAQYYVNDPFEVHHFLKMVRNELRSATPSDYL